MKNVTKFFLGLIVCVAIATSLEATITLPFITDKIADSKIPAESDSIVIFDGFAPKKVGPSPSNQEDANDPFRYFQVYLPKGYNDPERATLEYPVIYFLHGFGLNHTCYAALFSRLIQDIPLIVVKVDASLENGYLGSFYTHSSVNGNFEHYLIDELPNYIDTKYRTKKSKHNTIIWGHSMGAYGALLLAMKHPNRFGTVLAFSPPPIVAIGSLVNHAEFYEDVRLEIPESGDGAGKVLPTNGPNSYQLFAWSAALSPNDDNPFLVDLPILVDSDFVPVITSGMLTPDLNVIEKWEENDPFTLITDNPKLLQNTNVLIAIGKNEPLIDIRGARKLHKRLNKLGIKHDFAKKAGSFFAPAPDLTPYSPSNDVQLRLAFPTLQRVANLLVANPTERPKLLVDLVVRALQTDPTAFSDISLVNFGPFLDFCSITPPATIGDLLIDPNVRTCLSNNSLDPDDFIDGYFQIAQLINIDPFFFKIDTDGFDGIIG